MCRKPFEKNFTKTTGVFVNLLYIIAGTVMMGFGISIKATPDFFLSLYGHYGLDVNIVCDKIMEASAVFMIVVSVIIILTGMFGIYCFLTETDLVVYAVMQMILVVSNIVLIIFAAVYPSQGLMKEKMKTNMIDSFPERDIIVDNSSVVTYLPVDLYDNAWASTQLGTTCCGIDGPKDYLSIPEEDRTEELSKYGQRVLSVPLSCCALKPDTTPMELLDIEKCIGNDSQVINQKGCFASVMVYYAYSSISVYRISPIMIIFEIGLIFLALKFNHDLKSYETIE